MKKKTRPDSMWSVKYEFSSGPHWLALWYGTWAFITDRSKRARFASKEEARQALSVFRQSWYRPIGTTRPYTLVCTWKHGKKPVRSSVRIRAKSSCGSPEPIPGPWQKEGQELIWTSRRTGLPMIIQRSSEGYLQGFVGISPDNYLFGARDELLTVHGGVSYCGRSVRGTLAFPDLNLWWFGFHAGHCTDVIPSNPVRVFQDSSYKTMTFMRRQCEKLGEQIRRFDILVANSK